MKHTISQQLENDNAMRAFVKTAKDAWSNFGWVLILWAAFVTLIIVNI